MKVTGAMKKQRKNFQSNPRRNAASQQLEASPSGTPNEGIFYGVNQSRKYHTSLAQTCVRFTYLEQRFQVIPNIKTLYRKLIETGIAKKFMKIMDEAKLKFIFGSK